MATDKREVELIIRANNLGKQTMKATSDSIKRLSTDLRDQVNAARSGADGLNDLKKTYSDLESAGKKLISQASLVSYFRSTQDAVEKASQRLNRAKLAYETLAAEQVYLGETTKEQDNQFKRLTRTISVAQKEYDRLSGSLNTAGNQLSEVGIDVKNLAQAQEQLVASAREQAAAVKLTEAAMEDARIAAKALAEQKLWEAKAADAVKARQAADYVRFWTESLEKAEQKERELAAVTKTLGAAENIFRKAPQSAEEYAQALEKARQKVKQLETDARAAFTALRESERMGTGTAAQAQGLDKLIQKLREAQKEMNGLEKETREANAQLAKNPFESNGRTTLSLLQRLRGEILAVTASYVGLQGAIQGVASVLTSARSAEQIQASLLVSNGNDAKKAGDEYKYLREQAQRLGIFFPQLAKQYGNFAIAAKQANLPIEELRFIFEGVAEAGQVMQLSEDDLNGIFNAITQMVSKGKIQSEELRQQLGDRLPGALQFAAKKYEGGVAEFVKQLELGNVEAQNGLVNLVRGLDEAFNEQFAKGDEQLRRQEGRFKTAVYDFQQIVAQSGITEAYTTLLKRLTEFFNSSDGKEFAKNLGVAFKELVGVLILLIDNLETVKSILTVVVGLWAARSIFNAAVGLVEYTNNLKALNKELLTTKSNMAKLESGFLALQTFAVSFSIGKTLQAEVPAIRRVGLEIATFLQEIWIRIKYQAQINFAGVTDSFTDMMAGLVRIATQQARDIVEVFRDLAKATGAEGVASAFDDVLNRLTVAGSEGTRSRIEELKRGMEDEIKTLQTYLNSQIRSLDKTAKDAKQSAGRATAAPTGSPDPGGNEAAFTKNAEKAANTYKSLLAQVEAAEASSLKKQKESLQSLLTGVDKQYEALFRKIRESGVQGAAELEARLRQAVNVIKAETEKGYIEDQQRQLDAIQKRFAEIQTTIARSDTGTLADRYAAIDEKYRSLYDDINQLDKDRQGNLKTQLDLMVQQLRVMEEQDYAQDRIKDSQTQLNELVTERDEKIKTTTDLITAGLLTEQEGRQRIKQIIDESQAGILKQAEATREVVESMRGILDDSTIDMMLAKIDLAVSSAGRFKTELYSAAQASEDLATGLTGAISESAEGFGDAIAGAKSFGDAVRGAGQAFLQFAADFLRRIAEMIIQQMILNALQRSGWGGAISGAVNASVNHEGNVVGSAQSSRSRSVSPALFANAPRYHEGGMGGLASDEYATILKRNEEVLTEDDPRHVLNGGTASGDQTSTAPQPITVINALDSQSIVADAFAQPGTSKVVINWMQANRSAIQRILG